MNKLCPICCDIGWVYENHPNKPFDEELGCACGECNDSDPPDTNQVIVIEEQTVH